eukprot:2877553-Prymnesium_polylepis.1
MFTARVAAPVSQEAQSAPQRGKVGVQHPCNFLWSGLTCSHPRAHPTRTPLAESAMATLQGG